MYLKAAVLVACLAGSYGLLVFAAQTWWQGGLLAVVLGLAAAGVGFNLQHDGGHQGYSSRRWINRLMAMTLDMLGGSSYFWHLKHAMLHHTYVNIAGHDTDIDLGVLARLSPHQGRRRLHRWQHLYLWPLYGLLAVKWHLFADLRTLLTGHIRGHRLPRPSGWDLAILVGGKTIFFAWVFGIPLLFHSIEAVLVCYAIAAVVLGITMSVVFQLAHAVEEADFPVPVGETGRMEHAWAVHQAQTTVNFARRSRLAAWLLGGLNFQIEHHLFPKMSHVNYPAISGVVQATCRDFGVKYSEHTSFLAGLASHYRWLRRMGTPAALA
jgi:linoleoyl-CoA desaturase